MAFRDGSAKFFRQTIEYYPASLASEDDSLDCLFNNLYHIKDRHHLWWQQVPQPPGHKDRGDTRFTGGFAVYDAPEPWGPWTTAYFTPKWDVGPGEHADFPSKWMSADGRTMHLVFSGDDAFSVRRATVRLVAEAKQR